MWRYLSVAALLACVIGLSAAVDPCTTADIASSYTSCIGATRSAYYYYTKPCDASTGVPLPQTIINLPCYVQCTEGEYLPTAASTCAKCEAGRYSFGGGDAYETWDSWPTNIVSECSNYGPTDFPCSHWRLNGTFAESGDNHNSTYVYSNLRLNAVFLRSTGNKIRFTYKVEALDGDGFRFYIDEKVQHAVISRSPWTVAEYSVTAGYHTFRWTFSKDGADWYGLDALLISSIETYGTDYAADHCILCPFGTFANTTGASFCWGCPLNTYSDPGQTACTQCNTAISYSLPNSGACSPYTPCKATDYYETYGTCAKVGDQFQQITTQVVLGVMQDQIPICMNGVSAPPPVTGDCFCEAGSYLDTNGNCKSCGDGYYSDGKSCLQCAAGMVPFKIYSISRWTSLPPLFSTMCDGNCEGKGWIPRGDYISSGLHTGGAMQSTLSFNVTLAQAAGHVSFAYHMNCTGVATSACRLYVSATNRDDGSKASTVIFSRTYGEIRPAVVTLKNPGLYTIDFTFSLQALPYDTTNIAQIYSLTVDGVKDGVAATCSKCAAGWTSAQGDAKCSACPPGTYNPTDGGTCLPTPDGFFNDDYNSTYPIACGENTESYANHTECVNTCTYTPVSTAHHYYDLNPLYQSEIMHFAGVDTGGHTYWLNMCHREHTNSSCKDTAGKPIPSLSCQQISKADWAVDLGHVSGYGPLEDRLLAVLNIQPDSVLGLTVKFTEGSRGCAVTHNDVAVSRNTTVTMLCDVNAGVGTPNPILNRTAELVTRSCDYYFVWKSQYACPVCTAEDFTYERGACDGTQRTYTPVRIHDCWIRTPMPLRYEPCLLCAVNQNLTCNGQGICDEDIGTCTCPSQWTGDACEQCASGLFGAACESECPGGRNTPCNNQGTCNQGVDGTGVCACVSNHGGDDCSLCADGYEGDKCSAIPATIQDVVPWWAFVAIGAGVIGVGVFVFFLWRGKRSAEHRYARLALNQTEMEGDFTLPTDEDRDDEDANQIEQQ